MNRPEGWAIRDRLDAQLVVKRRSELRLDEYPWRADRTVLDSVSQSRRIVVELYADMLGLDPEEAARLRAADFDEGARRAVMHALRRGDYVVVAQLRGALPRRPTVFHPGTMHNHKPCGRWAEIQKDPRSGPSECLVCSNASPEWVLRAAIAAEFTFKPIALKHLNWYLADGGGIDFVEDANIGALLQQDPQVQRLFKQSIRARGTHGTVTGHIRLRQNNYSDSDFQFAFGSIDRFDYEADFTAGTFHGWFKDRYEWHPVYPGLYSKFPDDVARETNCVHAAAVELKSGTARDYWMVGEATIPIGVILSVSSGPTSR